MQSLFKGASDRGVTHTVAAMDDIRSAMLDTLNEIAVSMFPVVHLRIRYAEDVQDLWYLRGDLMAAIAAIDGEAAAKHKLRQITEMFKGCLPKGLSSRPSPLSEH